MVTTVAEESLTIPQSLVSLLINNKLKIAVVDKRNVSLSPEQVETLYSSYYSKVIIPFFMISTNSKDIQIMRKIGVKEMTDTIDDIYNTVLNMDVSDLYIARYDDTESVYTVVLSPQSIPLLSSGGFEIKIKNVSSSTVNIIREKIIAYEVVE